MTFTLNSIRALRSALNSSRQSTTKHTAKTIALVPTMGNLHDGHLELVRVAKNQADIVVVSIFVNPTQFGIGEDLDSYPRTLQADSQKLTAEGVDYIFTPSVQDMYPVMPPPTQVLTGAISQQFCGKTRPTHFDGVGLVVSKLFNIVQPDIAVFGQKDYQQLAIIRQLVRDLSYDINIIAVPIVRAKDGLALSSRNQYLTTSERQIAPTLHQQIDALATQLAVGEVNSVEQLHVLVDERISRINQLGFNVDYLEVKNSDLTEITDDNFFDIGAMSAQHWVIVTAAWLGKARLLDNQEVTIKPDVTINK